MLFVIFISGVVIRMFASYGAYIYAIFDITLVTRYICCNYALQKDIPAPIVRYRAYNLQQLLRPHFSVCISLLVCIFLSYFFFRGNHIFIVHHSCFPRREIKVKACFARCMYFVLQLRFTDGCNCHRGLLTSREVWECPDVKIWIYDRDKLRITGVLRVWKLRKIYNIYI